MKKLWTMPGALLAACMAASAASAPRMALKDGAKAYDSGAFDKALEHFDEAAKKAPDAQLDPAVPTYNAANALFRLERPDEAAIRYQEALRSGDLELQHRAYFNRGNALYQMAERDRASGQLQTAPQAIEESVRMFEKALLLKPGDPDSKVNYELALLKKQEIEQQVQQQQQQQQQDQQQKDQQQDQGKNENEDEKEKDQQADQQQATQQQDQQQPQAGPKPAEEMNPEEARLLLDKMKQEEQSYREQMRLIMGQPLPVEKDW